MRGATGRKEENLKVGEGAEEREHDPITEGLLLARSEFELDWRVDNPHTHPEARES